MNPRRRRLFATTETLEKLMAALRTFKVEGTIGDGLVSQVPAFLISLAAGLLVTRSTQRSNMPREFLQQIFSRPQALAVAGTFLIVLVFWT